MPPPYGAGHNKEAENDLTQQISEVTVTLTAGRLGDFKTIIITNNWI